MFVCSGFVVVWVTWIVAYNRFALPFLFRFNCRVGLLAFCCVWFGFVIGLVCLICVEVGVWFGGCALVVWCWVCCCFGFVLGGLLVGVLSCVCLCFDFGFI